MMPVGFCPLSVAFAFFLGLTFGSFGNVLILRLPAGKPITGRSQCPKCRKKLTAWELIPVLSYVLLGGRCRRCRKSISTLYPLVELGSAGLFSAAVILRGATISGASLALTLWLLLLIAVIDLRTQRIPDALNVPFIFLACFSALAFGRFSLLAPLILFAFFGAQWLLSRGKWVGSGDILLGVGIGFLLGDISRALLGLGLAYVLGAVVALFLLITKKATRKSHLPFGPFLALATVLTLVFGDVMLGLLVSGI